MLAILMAELDFRLVMNEDNNSNLYHVLLCSLSMSKEKNIFSLFFFWLMGEEIIWLDFTTFKSVHIVTNGILLFFRLWCRNCK